MSARAPGARLAFVALAVGAGALPAQAPGDARRIERRGQRLAADGAVRVWNLVGRVRVIGWARDSVAVTARVPEGATLFFGGGDRVVKVGVEERGGPAPVAELEIRVPVGARVWVKSASAPITVSGLTRDVELYSVGGELRVAGRPSTLRIESMDGPVTVADGATWLRARTSAGALRVRGPVDDAVLSTVGGEARLEGAVAQRARIETVTGAVRFAGDVAPGAQLGVDTNAGDVTLDVGPAGAALDLLTLNGRLTSAIPAVRKAMRAQGRGQAATLPGPPDAGRIEVRSFKGTIAVGADAP